MADAEDTSCAPEVKPAETSYVIGIDFGTTYSGVAWCWSGQPDNIHLVTRWKTKLNLTHDNAKVPTEIYYDPSDGNTFWGYDIPPDKEPIRWFKLLLADESDLSPDLRKSAKLWMASEHVKESKKTTGHVIADYLRLLWTHTVADIVKDRGEAAFNLATLKVWITVPAIWKKDACQRMRGAAKAAGILDFRAAGETTLDLVAEPEAAAMAVLDDFQGRPDIQENDVFVVCDAGGGTVDMISYAIDSVQPLMVRECVEGKGKMCGAIFVDEAFQSMLQTALGDKWKRLSTAGRKTLMNNEWEFGIKRLFNGSSQEWSVSVPVEAFSKSRLRLHRYDDKKGEVPLKGGQLKFTQNHIRTFFGTVLPHVRALIHEQIKAVEAKFKGRSPKAILLVGGLGSCDYLFLELQKEFEPQGISVLQPSGARPWTAICRGAVIRGLSDAEITSKKQSLIVSRVSRYSYGVTVNQIFNEKRHDPQDRLWDDRELCWKAFDLPRWYIRRGDDIYTDQPVQFNFYRLYARGGELEDQRFSVTIYYNDELHAPKRKTDEVRKLVTISVLVDTPFEELPVHENDKKQIFRKVGYVMQMTSTGIEMQWKVLINGRVQGEENVQFLHEGVRAAGVVELAA